jgi:hypothetical protein
LSWLIKKYIDADAEFLFVPSDKVLEIAHLQDAIPFDIPHVELSHRGNTVLSIRFSKSIN